MAHDPNIDANCRRPTVIIGKNSLSNGSERGAATQAVLMSVPHPSAIPYSFFRRTRDSGSLAWRRAVSSVMRPDDRRI